jgi:hypothetical protein
MMARTRNSTTERVHALPTRPLTSWLPSLLPTLLSFIGLTAVIVGILAMHVWMGGHGATTHHSASPTTFSSTLGSTDARTASAATPADHTADETPVSHATTSSGHAHAGPAAQVLAAITASAGDSSDHSVAAGCGENGEDEMALSMCVLAMVLVGVAWLLTPTGRGLMSSLIRRGPPLTYWVSRPAPTPSLTHLCISRT